MQVTETLAEGLKRTYSAKATAQEIAAKVDEKIEEVRPSAQLKGFRKGKVPQALLKKVFGKSMLQEAVDELIRATVSGHFEESGHRPAGEPRIKVLNEAFDAGDDLDLEFSYELMPEIPEVAFSAISLERMVVEVEDEKVDEALQNLAANAKSYAVKEGAAEDGDQVVIDFVGKIDGEPFDGGAAEDFPLVLGSNQFVPGFEPQLVGVAAGDERVVTVTFPEEYAAEALAGKEAAFDVTVKEVKAAADPVIDDEFAKKYGAESLEAMRTQVRDRIGEEYRVAARSLMKRKLLDQLNDLVDFDVPESMLAQEAEQVARQLATADAAAGDADAEDGDASEGREGAEDGGAEEQDAATAAAPEVTDEHRTLAKRRVKLGLLLAELGGKNNITLTDAEVQNAIIAQARRYPGQEREFLQFVESNPGLKQQISAPAFEDKVVDFIFELSSVSDKPVSVDELKTALEALDDED